MTAPTMNPPISPVRPRRRWRRRLLIGVGILSILPVLFAVNGLILADRETPRTGQFDGIALAPTASEPDEVTVLAYNIAKGWAHRGGMSFQSEDDVRTRLRPMAELIRAERPDVVMLSEVLFECGPCPVNQVEFLARECGLPYWATGENYNIGVPGYRIVGGNAILSRTPLTPIGNPSLIGRKPFYATSNNRRALFAETEFPGQRVLLGALHNDSFDPMTNDAQVQQILEFLGERPCVLAGDFNAKPNSPSMKRIRESGRFTGEFDGPPSFTGEPPLRRIDFALAPATWIHQETRVIAADPSDHRPVVARFHVRE